LGEANLLARNEKTLLINGAGWLIAEPHFPGSILSEWVIHSHVAA